MRFYLKLNSCCCFNLRTGGFIIGYLELILSILSIIQAIFSKEPKGDEVFNGVSYLIELICVSLWLYGLHANKYKYLLAEVIWSSFVVCAVILASIAFMVILAFSGGSAVNGAADLPFIGTYIAVGIFVYVVLAVVGFLKWYFFSVQYSLYKLMKEESRTTQGRV